MNVCTHLLLSDTYYFDYSDVYYFDCRVHTAWHPRGPQGNILHIERKKN